MKAGRDQQADAEDPQELPLGEKRVPEDPQAVRVVIQSGNPVVGGHVQLQVAGHVAEDEADEQDPGHGHDGLLAHRRLVQGEEATHADSHGSWVILAGEIPGRGDAPRSGASAATGTGKGRVRSRAPTMDESTQTTLCQPVARG